MVDGMPCYCINAYGREDHQILDTYLVSEDGSGLYRLDRGEGCSLSADIRGRKDCLKAG